MPVKKIQPKKRGPVKVKKASPSKTTESRASSSSSVDISLPYVCNSASGMIYSTCRSALGKPEILCRDIPHGKFFAAQAFMKALIENDEDAATPVVERSADGKRICCEPSCTRVGVSFCSRCRVSCYCSQECQKAHWKGAHKEQHKNVDGTEINSNGLYMILKPVKGEAERTKLLAAMSGVAEDALVMLVEPKFEPPQSCSRITRNFEPELDKWGYNPFGDGGPLSSLLGGAGLSEMLGNGTAMMDPTDTPDAQRQMMEMFARYGAK
jgi:hypothetical protein